MMKNISYFYVCLGNIKIAHVFHHPVQAKNMNFNPYIYILYYQSNLLNYLPPSPVSYPYKTKYFICKEVLGQQGSETHEHNVMAMCESRHANVDKQRTLLADVDVAPPRGAVQIT